MEPSNTFKSCCKSCYLLSLRAGAERLRISRYAPAPDLDCFVDRYWVAGWSLLGRASFRSEMIPDPCVNLVISRGESRVFGVVSGKFSQTFRRSGIAVGIKFKPGGFYPFVKSPVSALTDSVIRSRDVFGTDAAALEAAIDAAQDMVSMINVVEQFLRERLPKRDEHVRVCAQIVDRINADREMTRAADVAADSGLSKRSLHRLFNQYVGVGPKQVIKCFRLQEAIHRLASGPVDWSQLAIDVGYFDQAHFINDFKAILGRTPTEYVTELRAAHAAQMGGSTSRK
jgi:AraC-like DNA-binding protein